MKKPSSKWKDDSASPATKQDVRDLGVLFERNNDHVQMIAEQVMDINRTLKSHTDTLKSHTEMIGSLMIDMTIVKENVEFLKGEVTKKVDRQEMIALERRVSLLEKNRRY